MWFLSIILCLQFVCAATATLATTIDSTDSTKTVVHITQTIRNNFPSSKNIFEEAIRVSLLDTTTTLKIVLDSSNDKTTPAFNIGIINSYGFSENNLQLNCISLTRAKLEGTLRSPKNLLNSNGGKNQNWHFLNLPSKCKAKPSTAVGGIQGAGGGHDNGVQAQEPPRSAAPAPRPRGRRPC